MDSPPEDSQADPAAARGARRRRRRRLFGLAALALGVLLALVLGEITTRVLGLVSEPRRHFRPGAMAADPELGWGLLPSYDGVRYEYDHQSRTTSDSRGYRGPEWTPERARAPIRVLCLGDSVTYSLGVNDQEAYPAQLEAVLRGRGQDAAVYNSGVPGYDTAQEQVVFERLAETIRPTVVVVAWLPNDLEESSEEVRKHIKIIDGYMIKNEQKFQRWKRQIEHRDLYASALYRFLRVRSQNVKEALQRRFAPEQPLAVPTKDMSYSTDALDRIAKRTAALGAKLVVVVVPSKDDVAGQGSLELHQRLGEYAKALGAEVVDLASAWRGAPRPGRYLLRDRLHFSPSGCQELAEAVASTPTLTPP